jgi:hypothetical protein
MVHGAETCYLGAMSHGADPSVQIREYVLQGLNVNFFPEKGLKCKRYGLGSLVVSSEGFKRSLQIVILRLLCLQKKIVTSSKCQH